MATDVTRRRFLRGAGMGIAAGAAISGFAAVDVYDARRDLGMSSEVGRAFFVARTHSNPASG